MEAVVAPSTCLAASELPPSIASPALVAEMFDSWPSDKDCGRTFAAIEALPDAPKKSKTEVKHPI